MKTFNPPKPIQPVYLGCHLETGHYFFSPGMLSFKYFNFPDAHYELLDGCFTPKSNNAQGAAAIHVFDQYVILSFHDYTVDHRGGSNSTFVIPCDLMLTNLPHFDAAIMVAKELFPEVFKRMEHVRIFLA